MTKNRKWCKHIEQYTKEQAEFVKIISELGADYTELDGDDDIQGIFICPVYFDNNEPVGIMCSQDGYIQFGYIDSDCMNFCNESSCAYAREELVWVIKLLNKLKRNGYIESNKSDKEAIKTEYLFEEGKAYSGNN